MTTPAPPFAIARGLAVCAVIAAVAWALGGAWSALGAPTASLLLGLLAGGMLRRRDVMAPGVSFAAKQVLALTIVVLGFSVDVGGIVAAGPGLLGVLAVLIVGGLLVSWGAARLLGLPRGLALLVGVGTAICGTAAIAATAPIVSEEEGDPGIAIGVIHAMGLVGLVLVPLVVAGAGLSEDAAGVLVGGSLHALGHVVAAGYALSEQTGDIATTVKLARIAMLVPTVLVLSLLMRRPGRLPVPWEVLGFAVVAGAVATGVFPSRVIRLADTVSDGLLAVAMVGIGASIDVSRLRRAAPRAFALGGGLFAVQTGVLLSWLLLA